MMKRLENSLPDAVPVFKILANKASFWIINRSSVPLLIKKAIRQDADESSTQAHQILLYISKRRALLFSTHISEFQSLLTDKRPHAPIDLAIQCLAQAAMASRKEGNPGANLSRYAFSSCVARMNLTLQSFSRVLDRVKKLCDIGTASQAKYAARLLAQSQNSADMEDVVASAIEALNDSTRESPLLAPLCALREFVKRDVDVVKPKVDAILAQVDAEFLSVAVGAMVCRRCGRT